MRKLIFCILLMSCFGISYANDMQPVAGEVNPNVSFEHVIWGGIPISFTVPVGQERIIKFPSRITFIKGSTNLTNDKVQILNNDGYLYIKAKKEFSPIRLGFSVRNTNQVVLLDLSAKENVSDEPVSVVMQSHNSEENQDVSTQTSQAIGIVGLVRYAISHLYGPTRLELNNDNVVRAPMYTSRSINLFTDNNLLAMPVASWQANNLYVTAIIIKNNYYKNIRIDPRTVRGSWIAASMFPTNVLGGKNSENNRTTIFLVSDKPFNDALNQIKGYVR